MNDDSQNSSEFISVYRWLFSPCFFVQATRERLGSLPSPSSGTANVIVVPTPRTDSAVRVAPIRSAACLETARPRRPAPFALLLDAGAGATLNSPPDWSGGVPGPSSVTLTTQPPPSRGRTVIWTLPPLLRACLMVLPRI